MSKEILKFLFFFDKKF